jgi:hypothetical protein
MLNAFTPEQMSFTAGQVVLNLCLAFALAFLVSTAYRKVHTGPTYSMSFFLTLLVTPVVVAMIMMAIGSNVALSLGLVGALSIIRFRTVIKDSRDMTYLFLVVAIGLCCGSGAYALAVLGTFFVCGVVVATYFATRSGLGPAEYILVFRNKDGADESTGRRLDELVGWRKLHGVADLGESDGCEYTYRVRLRPGSTPESLLDKLREMKHLSQSSLISPESQLAL